MAMDIAVRAPDAGGAGTNHKLSVPPIFQRNRRRNFVGLCRRGEIIYWVVAAGGNCCAGIVWRALIRRAPCPGSIARRADASACT